MQQTIQFDPQVDPVSTVLLQVARAYGYTGITEAMASNGKPQGVYPTRTPQVAYKPLKEKIVWSTPGAFEPDPDPEMAMATDESPWTAQRALSFIHQLTVPVQRTLALLIVKGQVTQEELMSYLDVSSLQGVFSSVGSAVRNTPGLPEGIRPYSRVRSPRQFYRMEPSVQRTFRYAFEESRAKLYLTQAEQYANAAAKVGR